MEIDVAETSKELDAETSLYYFGARYYAKHPLDDPFSARWLSVDPMAEKYPGWSPGVDQICRGSVLEYSFVNG